ncbi:MAG: hypothetical protein Q8M16_14420 [Pirellulaceae bacterium]|nr:hypothetical protein [Pirellulaceae bacterium]
MSKTTFILLNHRTAWVGAGESGAEPILKSLHKIDLASLTTVEEQAAAICGTLGQERLAKKSVVLVLGPQQTEYRPFQVPLVGASELPTIVANLASTRMTKIDDDSIVDFVAMPAMSSGGNGTSGGTGVLVTATSFQTNLLLRELKNNGLTFARILPRLIAPNLLRDSSGADVQVMVHVLGSEIDFVATQAKQVVMVRSSVIPTEGDDRSKLLARETSRSFAVLAAEFGRTEKMDLAVVAAPNDAAAVTGAIAAQDLIGRTVSPADYGTLPAGFDAADAAYASLALAALRLDRRPLLDLANPTRPPKDNAVQRKILMAIAVAATIVVGLVGMAWLEIRKLDQQLTNLQADVKNLEVAEDSDKQTIARVGMINEFVTMDVAPLHLMETLSEQLPYGDEMRVQSLKLNVGSLNNEKSFPGTMTTRLKNKELLELYNPKLRALPGWEVDPTPNSPNVTSKYYDISAVDKFRITPDFSTVYERLVTAILGEEQNGDLELDEVQEPETTDAPPTEPESFDDGDGS